MKLGHDSAFAPSPAQAARARSAGVVWWGVYVGGPGAYRVWWPDEIAVVKDAGIIPVPIWVPTNGLGESPVDAAHLAVSAVAVLPSLFEPATRPVVYSGGGFVPVGVAEWRPLHVAPTGEPVGELAFQWGQTDLDGLTVDLDEASDLFPLSGVIVLDTEEAMDASGRVPGFVEAWCATVQPAAPPPPLSVEEGDLSNLVVYHDTTTLVWKLVNTATDTLVANLTGDPQAVASFEAAGGKVLAWPGAGAQFN